MADCSVICFDAEFSDSQQILELAVLDLAGEELFHEYFKPEREYTWRKSMAIHHITPAMVRHRPPFRAALGRVQKIVDRAVYVVGGAVGNDISHLVAAGVKGLDAKRVFDIRDMYWMMTGRDSGEARDSVPGVHRIAESAGIEFDETKVHSAIEDTRVTLEVFRHYLHRFSEISPVEGEPLDSLIARCHDALGECIADYRRRAAAGFLALVQRQRGVMLKSNASAIAPVDGLIASVGVEDRFKAEYDIRSRFQHRKVSSSPQLYDLRKADIDWFKAYTNLYDADEAAMYREKHRLRLFRML